MHERNTKPEILQQRADTFIMSLRNMVRAGLNPYEFQLLEEYASRRLRDVVQVYLGIKPAASYTPEVAETFFTIRRSYVSLLSHEKDIGFSVFQTYDQDGTSCWNPLFVADILNENNDLRGASLLNPYDYKNFGSFLDGTDGNEIPDRDVLEGLVFGIPRIAADQFSRYYIPSYILAEQLFETARDYGVTIKANPPLFLLDLSDSDGLHNPDIRDEFVRLAELFHYPNQELLFYIRNLRLADVPGWRYITSGQITNTEEKHNRDLYENSQFEKKFQRFLNEYGKT